MPQAWTKKEERQYEHIRDSTRKEGKSLQRSKEIAARTVNKLRREHGETPQKRTQGTGNPHRKLTERTRDELYNLAKERGVSGRSRMTKAQLARALGSK